MSKVATNLDKVPFYPIIKKFPNLFMYVCNTFFMNLRKITPHVICKFTNCSLCKGKLLSFYVFACCSTLSLRVHYGTSSQKLTTNISFLLAIEYL